MADNRAGDSQEHVSVAEAAGILGISQRTVWNWLKAGKLKGEKIEGKTMIPVELVLSQKENEGVAYNPETHVLIDRSAFDAIMRELQASREMASQHGYKIGQIETEKRHLEEHIRLIEDKRPWWRRWRRE